MYIYVRIGSNDLLFWRKGEILLELEIANSTGKGKVACKSAAGLTGLAPNGNSLVETLADGTPTIDTTKLHESACILYSRSLIRVGRLVIE